MQQVFVFYEKRQEGPYTLEQIEELLNIGTITPITLAWCEGMREWTPLNTILPTKGSKPPRLPSHFTGQVGNAVDNCPTKADRKPRGVGGWLLLFCVLLTIVGPFMSFGQMAVSWEEGQDVFQEYPNLYAAVVVETIGCSIIVISGFIVGCIVIRESPLGRRVAERYLDLRFIGFIALEVVSIVMMSNIPEQIFVAVVAGAVGAVFREFVFYSVWRLYFMKSKRVFNTFGAN